MRNMSCSEDEGKWIALMLITENIGWWSHVALVVVTWFGLLRNKHWRYGSRSVIRNCPAHIATVRPILTTGQKALTRILIIFHKTLDHALQCYYRKPAVTYGQPTRKRRRSNNDPEISTAEGWVLYFPSCYSAKLPDWTIVNPELLSLV